VPTNAIVVNPTTPSSVVSAAQSISSTQMLTPTGSSFMNPELKPFSFLSTFNYEHILKTIDLIDIALNVIDDCQWRIIGLASFWYQLTEECHHDYLFSWPLDWRFSWNRRRDGNSVPRMCRLHCYSRISIQSTLSYSSRKRPTRTICARARRQSEGSESFAKS
jgi:hypothetical protein